MAACPPAKESTNKKRRAKSASSIPTHVPPPHMPRPERPPTPPPPYDRRGPFPSDGLPSGTTIPRLRCIRAKLRIWSRCSRAYRRGSIPCPPELVDGPAEDLGEVGLDPFPAGSPSLRRRLRWHRRAGRHCPRTGPGPSPSVPCGSAAGPSGVRCCARSRSGRTASRTRGWPCRVGPVTVLGHVDQRVVSPVDGHLVVVLGLAVQEQDHVGVLLQGARLPEVGEHGGLVLT